MKQLVFMMALTAVGTIGPFVIDPFLGVAVYYVFAILRPQFLWEWSLPPGIPWSLYVGVATLVATAAAIVGLLPSRFSEPHDGPARPRWTLSQGCILFFSIWMIVTYHTAINQDWAYPWLIETIKLLIMCGVASMLIRTTRQVLVLFLLAAFSIGYIASEVNFQYFSSGYNYLHQHGYGGYDNNGAALIMAMGIPMCFFASEALRGWRKWVPLAFVPLTLHALLMSFSRGAMLAILLVSPVMLLRSRLSRIAKAAAVALGIVAVSVMAGREIRDRFFSVNQYQTDGSAQSRLASWTAAWRIANDYPVFGAGVRNANLLSHRYGADFEGRTIHNQYLQLAADCGFPGVTLYVAILIAGWFDTRRVRLAAANRQDERATRAYALAAGVECSMLIFCIDGVFLSLETFELSYLLLLVGAQLNLVGDSIVYDPPAPVAPSEYAPV